MPSKKTAPIVRVKALEDEGRSPEVNESAPEEMVGARIRKQRELLGLNFEQFAALTREYDPEGIAAVTLRRYEREGEGATLPGLRELRVLCDALAVSADYLLLARTTPDYELRDRADWEALKAVLNRIVDKGPLAPAFGQAGPDPYANLQRQEKLKRARLHTKAKGE